MQKQNDLIQKHFKELKSDTYIIFRIDGEFLLGPEYRINDRYTVRDYKVNTPTYSIIGKIYTNNLESLQLTLNRLLKEFNRNCTPSASLNEIHKKDDKKIHNQNMLTAV